MSAILAQRQFHPAPNWWRRSVDWLRAHLHLPAIHLPGLNGGAWQSYVVLVVLLAGVAAALTIATRRGFFQRWRHPRAAPGVVVTEESGALSPAEWLERAGRFAAEGRFREALRCRYCALVGELAGRGLLDEVPGRTSGDYERLVRASVPEVAQQFAAVTALFEACWYGHEPSDAQEQVLFDRAAQLVLREVGAGRWQAGRHGGPGGPDGPARPGTGPVLVEAR
ncbi:MAG: DUF4129 domain-containing protein [Acidimicrobiales bacterium]